MQEQKLSEQEQHLLDRIRQMAEQTPVPSALLPDVQQALLSKAAEKRARQKRRQKWYSSAAAAAACLIVVLAAGSLRQLFADNKSSTSPATDCVDGNTMMQETAGTAENGGGDLSRQQSVYDFAAAEYTEQELFEQMESLQQPQVSFMAPGAPGSTDTGTQNKQSAAPVTLDAAYRDTQAYLLKQSDDSLSLETVSDTGETTAQTSVSVLEPEINGYSLLGIDSAALSLSDSTLLVTVQLLYLGDAQERTVTSVAAYDLQNGEQQLLWQTAQDGSYLSSVTANGVFYLVTQQAFLSPQQDAPESFLPARYTASGSELLDAGQVLRNSEAAYPRCTTLSSTDCATGALISAAALLDEADLTLADTRNIWLLKSSADGTQTAMTVFALSDGALHDVFRSSVSGSLVTASLSDALCRIVTQQPSGEVDLALYDSAQQPCGTLTDITQGAPLQALQPVCFTEHLAYFFTESQEHPLVVVDCSDPYSPTVAEVSGQPDAAAQWTVLEPELLVKCSADGDTDTRLTLYRLQENQLSELDAVTLPGRLLNQRQIAVDRQAGLLAVARSEAWDYTAPGTVSLLSYQNNQWNTVFSAESDGPVLWVSLHSENGQTVLAAPDRIVILMNRQVCFQSERN